MDKVVRGALVKLLHQFTEGAGLLLWKQGLLRRAKMCGRQLALCRLWAVTTLHMMEHKLPY